MAYCETHEAMELLSRSVAKEDGGLQFQFNYLPELTDFLSTSLVAQYVTQTLSPRPNILFEMLVLTA